ncbi:hypothetical protein ACI65C_001863 [Semiaphis heraclei]
MSANDENDSSEIKDISKINLNFYESSLELRRIEEKCRLKVKSIEEIEHSIKQVTFENEWIEKQLHDTKSRINEVRENIVNLDNITISLNETLAHLEIEHEKKTFKVNKSKCEYELQLFIRMELWQKEEERLNSIPEVKLFKNADSELKNTKLEYENLLLSLQNLVEKIDIATKENDEKQNHIIVQFAKVYIEMMSLNRREENCKALLKKLNTEFKEKCYLKNGLLESQKNKINKVSFWSHIPSKFESKIFDIKFNSLDQDLKPNSSNYNHANCIYDENDMDIKDSKSNNKKKKKVTFQSFSKDEISPETSDDKEDGCKNINTFVAEIDENINNNSAQLKNILDVKERTIQFKKNDIIESKDIQYSKNNDKHNMNDGDLNAYTNKRKTIDVPSDFKFKKPYIPVLNNNKMCSTIIQPSKMKINKDDQIDGNFNQEKVKELSLSIDSYNNDNFPIDKDHLQKINFFKYIELPNVSLVQNEDVSDAFWNYCSDPMSQNSGYSSLCGSDFSELYGNTHDIGQYSDNMQLNFSNYFKSDLDITP